MDIRSEYWTTKSDMTEYLCECARDREKEDCFGVIQSTER